MIHHSYTSPWLDKLNFDWSELYHLGQKVEVNKGDILYHVGDTLNHIYIVIKGRIQLYLINEEGKEKAIVVIGRNGLLGEYKKQENNYYITNSQAVTDAELIKISKKLFEKALDANKQLDKQRLEMLSIKVELLAHNSLYLSYDSSLNRIVRMFLNLATSYGENTEIGAIKIGITFTHQEIAYLVGTTRVNVANIIKNLVNSNLIMKKNRYYYVIDYDKLQETL